jgi:hypothetical protein
MLKSDVPLEIAPPEIPQAQMEAIQPVLEPLLARLRSQTANLAPQADSALVFTLTGHEAGQ